MPARSNDFQAVVYFIRSHVDADAVVTESAMLPDRTGAGLREVDVLITSRARDGRGHVFPASADSHMIWYGPDYPRTAAKMRRFLATA
ncbi:hypothetical protein [Nonomuraea sp. NPDC003201]